MILPPLTPKDLTLLVRRIMAEATQKLNMIKRRRRNREGCVQRATKTNKSNN
jgi:hypothetical protein